MPSRKTRTIPLLLCFLLIFQQSGFAQIAGQLDVSGYLAGLRSSFVQDKFRPLHLRYLAYDSLNNNFKLLLDQGSLKQSSVQELKDSTQTLLNYFFVGISLPNDSFWVNLRPDSADNIIDDYLAQTDVGKILLEADLQLKKDTAKATSPETAEGKIYWDKLYKKAEELLGQENITIPTLVRPWIVPGEIIIRETANNAYIYKATLKVMLEDDYLKGSNTYNFTDPRLKALNQYSSQLLKERIIPELTREVNTSKRYAALRQVYYSLILAQWFKSRFYGKGGLYSHLIDQRNLTGLISQGNWSKIQYFKEYQKNFKDGEYNVKEPVSTPYGQNVRSYFSGGIDITKMQPAMMNGVALNGSKEIDITTRIKDLSSSPLIAADFRDGKIQIAVEQKNKPASSPVKMDTVLAGSLVYNTEILSEPAEIRNTLKTWLKATEKRHFGESQWEQAMEFNPDGFLVKLESEKDRELHMAISKSTAQALLREIEQPQDKGISLASSPVEEASMQNPDLSDLPLIKYLSKNGAIYIKKNEFGIDEFGIFENDPAAKKYDISLNATQAYWAEKLVAWNLLTEQEVIKYLYQLSYLGYSVFHLPRQGKGGELLPSYVDTIREIYEYAAKMRKSKILTGPQNEEKIGSLGSAILTEKDKARVRDLEIQARAELSVSTWDIIESIAKSHPNSHDPALLLGLMGLFTHDQKSALHSVFLSLLEEHGKELLESGFLGRERPRSIFSPPVDKKDRERLYNAIISAKNWERLTPQEKEWLLRMHAYFSQQPDRPASSPVESANSDTPLINKIDKVLERHIGKVVALADLAREAGLNEEVIAERINQINWDKEQPLLINPAGDGNMYITNKKLTSSLVEEAQGSAFIRKIEEEIINANGLIVSRGIVTAGQNTLDIIREERESMFGRYLRVGPVLIISNTLKIPEAIKSQLDKGLIVTVAGQIGYDRYLISMIAAMLQQDFRNKIVEDDGTGDGTLALIALKLGARRVIGIDYDEGQLKLFQKKLERLGYSGRYLRAEEWQSYQPQAADQFILIHDDLRNWFRATFINRAIVVGGAPHIRLAHIGPAYAELQSLLIKDVIQDTFNTKFILGGYIDGRGTEMLMGSSQDVSALKNRGREVIFAAYVEGNRVFTTIIALPKAGSSSPIDKKGGIDFRALPISTQPLPANTGFNLSPASLSNPRQIDLESEWHQIQDMLKTGIIPSSQRITEYLEACFEKGGMDGEIDKVLACVADILRLEEERSQATDNALKEILILLDSDRPIKDRQRALINITILPQEPGIKP